MRFRKYGQSYHLRIRDSKDLALVPDLEEAHWVATGAPTKSIHSDPAFEQYLDIDNNERIMCFELREAILWVLTQLKDHKGIDAASPVLELEAIDTEQTEGKRIRETAGRMLRQLRKSDETSIQLDDIRKIKQKVESEPVSEAGVVIPSATKAQDIRDFIKDIIATLGGVQHPGGENGVNQEQLDNFLEQAKGWTEWRTGCVIPAGQAVTPIMPLGVRTHEAFALYQELSPTIEQYFAQCRAVALNRSSTEYFDPTADTLKSTDLTSPEAINEMLKKAPLAPPSSEAVLRITDQINPFYAASIGKLRTSLVNPVLERPAQTLSIKEWNEIKETLKPYTKWMAAKTGADVESLGADKLEKYQDPRFKAAVMSLINESNKTAVEMDRIRELEKLVLYQANILMLVNNFVSFPYLYDPESRAVFETGTLIIDGRELNFSVLVENRAEHAKIAQTSNIFTLYVNVAPGQGREPFEVAVPVTSGGKGNLCVGKRGLFRELNGKESDARVVQIIENPISIGETLASPFQRLGKVLSGKIEAMTTSAEKQLDQAAMTPTAAATQATQPKGAMAGGLLMGGGVAIAALSSAFAFITKTLSNVAGYKIVIGIAVAILAVIMPACIVALIKLRRRDLSAILEGAGWAINARMRLTFSQGRMFTRHPKRPGKDLFSIT